MSRAPAWLSQPAYRDSVFLEQLPLALSLGVRPVLDLVPGGLWSVGIGLPLGQIRPIAKLGEWSALKRFELTIGDLIKARPGTGCP
jgi:hypothetical protein